MKKGLTIGFFILLILFPLVIQPVQARYDGAEDDTLLEQAMVLRETYMQITDDIFKITNEIFEFVDADKKEIEANRDLSKHMEEFKNVALKDRANSKEIKEALKNKIYSSLTDNQLCDEISFLESQISYQNKMLRLLKVMRREFNLIDIKNEPTRRS